VFITDGPYAETKEHIGGFWVLEAADLDEALAWGRKAAVACRASAKCALSLSANRWKQLSGMDAAQIDGHHPGACPVVKRVIKDVITHKSSGRGMKSEA